MDLWQEILASVAVITLGIWFVAWCLHDSLADARWWKRHGDH